MTLRAWRRVRVTGRGSASPSLAGATEGRHAMDGTATRPGQGPTWWRRIVALTALVAVAAVLGGEGDPASAGRRAAPADPSAPTAALFVGDSIMRSAVGELQLRLVDRSGGWATAFVASGGLGVDDSPYVGPRIS